MKVYQLVLIAVVLVTALPIALHHHVHHVLDADQMALAFFLGLNVIISLWEMCLFFRIDQIERQHVEFLQRYKGRELDRVTDFFNTHVPFGKVLSPSVWAELWSSYSVFDESYANRKSFGFFIDVGNGFSTIVPTIVCIVAMTYEFLPARTVGIVLLIVNYQMWYGTLVYFGSFLFNKRFHGHTRFNLALFVGFTNGLWFTFPVWGMWCALRMIYSGSYEVFHG
jgi:hypothetical protein